MMEVAGGNPAAGADIEPGEEVRSGRQIQVQFGRSVAIEIDCVHTRGRRKNSRINTLGMLDRMPVRRQVQKGQGLQEFEQNAQLAAQGRAAAARAIRFAVSSVFVPHGKGIVEIIKLAAAGKKKIPGLPEIVGVDAAEKA